ncbi:protein ABHD15-like [Mytilus edulis]|uniref:ABHD15 n=1 Tax=Mytilus edulis TaxID=6550 RepID=A0A8S3U8Q2_MYTED|nr:ABHD15 [Mytilus edulis]
MISEQCFLPVRRCFPKLDITLSNIYNLSFGLSIPEREKGEEVKEKSESPNMLAFYTIIYLPFYVAIIGTILWSALCYIKSLLQTTEVYPRLYFKESTLASHLIKKCRLATRQFSPPFWIRNKHIQTFLPFFIPQCSVQFKREYLQLKDRGVVALDWVVNLHLHRKKRRTVLIVIPGLCGTAGGLSKICQYASKRGFQPVVFNRRGLGNSFLTTPKLQSYGDPSDFRQVIKYINGKYPKALVTCVSYGTGSECLLSYLGEFGSSAQISAGVSVSASFEVAHRTSTKLHGIYDLLFLTLLKRVVWKHAKALTKIIDVPKALKAWTYKQFDEAVFCQMYGYSDLEEFWDRNNPLRDVDDISVPLLFISSEDDPLHSNKHIPLDLFKYYPNFFMLMPKYGGHGGFLDDIAALSWADRVVIDYLEAILEFTMKGYTINYNKSPARSTI